ncbi:MAG: hypothetical protein ACXABY_23010 [Candidatus Thorarchaeota archaeon]|jgi:hypothetical protein
MGLDMYLKEQRYFSHYKGLAETHDHYREEYEKSSSILDVAGITTTVDGSITVSATVMYWRKANAIHQWFVDNVQDGEDECREHYVPREKLEELRDLCQRVLEDHSLAPTLLPSRGGFFFGSTGYDEWYFGDLGLTMAGIGKVLDNLGKSSELYYQSSW